LAIQPQRPVERAPEVGHYTNGAFCMYGLLCKEVLLAA